MTPDRHTSEDELVRAHLHLANQAVSELARRLPSHVNRDDLSSAAMLGPAQAARPHPAQDELAAELGTDTRAVQRLVDDVHQATMLNFESIVADGEAADLPSGDRAPDHAAIAACSDFRPGWTRPAAPARAGRREPPGGAHSGLNPRSGNRFA
jgi:hypothetical protein